MSSSPIWDNGSWNVICDSCGRRFKAGELKLRWDGLMVCSGDWEPRQPQDYVRGVADIQAPKWTRPEQADVFVPIHYSQQPSEPVDISETVRKTVTKGLSESLSLSETVRTFLGRSFSETISISEATTKRTTKSNTESLSISESIQLNETERTVESLGVTEVFAKVASKTISESVGIAEAVSISLATTSALNGSALNSRELD